MSEFALVNDNGKLSGVLRDRPSPFFSFGRWLQKACHETDVETGVIVMTYNPKLDPRIVLRFTLKDFVEWKIESDYWTKKTAKKSLKELRAAREAVELVLESPHEFSNDQVRTAECTAQMFRKREEYIKGKYLNDEIWQKCKDEADVSLLNGIRIVTDSPLFLNAEKDVDTGKNEPLKVTQAVRYIAAILGSFGVTPEQIFTRLKRNLKTKEFWGKDENGVEKRPPFPEGLFGGHCRAVWVNDKEVFEGIHCPDLDLVILEEEPFPCAVLVEKPKAQMPSGKRTKRSKTHSKKPISTHEDFTIIHNAKPDDGRSRGTSHH